MLSLLRVQNEAPTGRVPPARPFPGLQRRARRLGESAMAEKLRIALAGLGTVGAGVVKLLAQNAALIERRAGRGIEIVAVSARDRTRDRGIDLSGIEWVDDTASLAARDDVDAVVELIGG